MFNGRMFEGINETEEGKVEGNLVDEESSNNNLPSFAQDLEPTWHKEYLSDDATEKEIKAFYDASIEEKIEKYGVK